MVVQIGKNWLISINDQRSGRSPFDFHANSPGILSEAKDLKLFRFESNSGDPSLRLGRR